MSKYICVNLNIQKNCLNMAYHLALLSPDLSTQNGAVISDNLGHVIACGWNTFPAGVTISSQRLSRPDKYLFTEHAERAAIYQAAKFGLPTQGKCMVCCWAACTDCARAIIDSGITTLVRHKQASDRSNTKWLESIEVADVMLHEAGIEIIDYDGKVATGLTIRHCGTDFSP